MTISQLFMMWCHHYPRRPIGTGSARYVPWVSGPWKCCFWTLCGSPANVECTQETQSRQFLWVTHITSIFWYARCIPWLWIDSLEIVFGSVGRLALGPIGTGSPRYLPWVSGLETFGIIHDPVSVIGTSVTSSSVRFRWWVTYVVCILKWLGIKRRIKKWKKFLIRSNRLAVIVQNGCQSIWALLAVIITRLKNK